MKIDRGGEKWPIALGLTLLHRRCIYGVPQSQADIAAWAGVTRQRIEQIENRALRKLRFRWNKETLEELREFLGWRLEIYLARRSR